MKAKEILKNVCVYLGYDDLAEAIETGNVSEPNEKKLNKMLKCLNLVVGEIASEYLPVIKQKDVKLTNGQIDVYQIDEYIQEIISIKDKFGRNLKYKYTKDKVVCLASNVQITYKVYTKDIGLEDDVESFGGRLSERVIGYGVASEYAYLQMLYDDASIWENRYKNALLNCTRKKGEIKLKKRGWF